MAVAPSPNLEANICESIRIKDQLGQKLFLIHVDAGKGEAGRETILATIKDLGCSMDQVELVWEAGDPIEAILRVCLEKNIDLLVAGALPREGLLRYYRGSIARQLVRKSNCSILLMTNPQKFSQKCERIVVNGLDHPKTGSTIEKAIRVGQCLDAYAMSIVEEVQLPRKSKKVDDDAQLKKAIAKREAAMAKEEARIEQILSKIPDKEGIKISHKAIEGKPGYTIGHYTQTFNADLLVLNSPDTKLGFIDRVFTHDLEYILSELPSDILIVHSSAS